MVQRQFGADWEILPPRKFTFASEALKIDFERQLLEAGWILALESSNKVRHCPHNTHTHIEALNQLKITPSR